MTRAWGQWHVVYEPAYDRTLRMGWYIKRRSLTPPHLPESKRVAERFGPFADHDEASSAIERARAIVALSR